MFRALNESIRRFLNSGLFGFIGCLLLFILLYKLAKELPHQGPTPEQIEVYAKLFLENGPKERTGRRADCSGYTQEVFGFFAIKLPASATEQFKVSNRLAKGDLQKGDLLFFNTNGHSISHVGIYLDSSNFIHSPGKKRYVKIDNLENKYWKSTFICGGKIPLTLHAPKKRE